jgi:hypothetical protein
MIRKQVYIEERQERTLKRRARQRGTTEAEIIREALDHVEAGTVGNSWRPRLDPGAGRKAVAFMRGLASRRSKAPAGRERTREALYDDRISRWTKS